MINSRTWGVSLTFGIARSEAGYVTFSKREYGYQINSVHLFETYRGSKVSMCHEALKEIFIAEREQRLYDTHKVDAWSIGDGAIRQSLGRIDILA